AALAAEQVVRTVVGLQARQAPAIEFVQELLSEGYIGEVLSTTMVGLSVPGDVVGRPNAYMLDKTNGANVLTNALGHSLDILHHVLGEFADFSAVSALRRPLITIEETGEQIVKTAADQIAVIGTLTSGAVASIHVREAVAGGTGFLWEINGSDGTLRITADGAQPQIFPLTVAGAKRGNEPAELSAPAALTQKWPALTSLEGAPAYNVGRAYAAFAADMDNGTHTAPDFADAVRRHDVISCPSWTVSPLPRPPPTPRPARPPTDSPAGSTRASPGQRYGPRSPRSRAGPTSHRIRPRVEAQDAPVSSVAAESRRRSCSADDRKS